MQMSKHFLSTNVKERDLKGTLDTPLYLEPLQKLMVLPWLVSHPSTKFQESQSSCNCVMLLTDRRTDRR